VLVVWRQTIHYTLFSVLHCFLNYAFVFHLCVSEVFIESLNLLFLFVYQIIQLFLLLDKSSYYCIFLLKLFVDLLVAAYLSLCSLKLLQDVGNTSSLLTVLLTKLRNKNLHLANLLNQSSVLNF
jgi:hypothetical protein